MTKENLIRLTNNLYHLTSLFPKKEPLRFKIRELSDDILNSSISFFSHSPNKSKNLFFEIQENLNVLDSFFEVAKNQNWLSPAEILEIQEEYRNIESRLKEEFKKLSEVKDSIEIGPLKKEQDYKVVAADQIPSRQEKILALLREKEKLQVKDLQQIFPEVSKRTLRRDFEQLLRRGLVIRVGEKNNTSYQTNQS